MEFLNEDVEIVAPPPKPPAVIVSLDSDNEDMSPKDTGHAAAEPESWTSSFLAMKMEPMTEPSFHQATVLTTTERIKTETEHHSQVTEEDSASTISAVKTETNLHAGTVKTEAANDTRVKTEETEKSPTKVKTEGAVKQENDGSTQYDAVGVNPHSNKVRKEVQDKILAAIAQAEQDDEEAAITGVLKQDIVEASGYSKAGSHGFFYAWTDLAKYKKFVVKKTTGRFGLTPLGRDHVPRGVVLLAPTPKDNASKQASLLKRLVKQCKYAQPDKTNLMFEILKDGNWHSLDEFTEATGYANLKSRGLGDTFQHMIKKMRILEKNANNEYRFNDKCFPEGHPI